MLGTVLNAVIDELNPGRCLRDIVAHWSAHPTVPGPGMRAAGELLVKRYLENGAAEAELIPYPADDKTEFLDGRKNSLEWRPRDATLAVASPEAEAGTICRYGQERLCLMSNSTGTPPEGIRGQVVVRRGPLSEAQVAEGEFAGKLLFTDQFPSTVQGAARKGKAVGLISDCVSPPWLAAFPPVREQSDAPDLVMWTTLSAARDQKPLFGFNLSGRQGRRLRDLIHKSQEPVILHAFVDAELCEGSSDFVHAVLPGTDLADEEIWVLGHLSEPGAEDNASGCCLSAELARVLATLTRAGTLKPLRRTIRFMHGVEVAGFLPYIHANRERLPKVVAGFCLDSVGQDMALRGGQMVLFRSPEQNASFVDGLVEALLEAVASEPASRFCDDNYAAFPWRVAPFWGNDAFVSKGFFDIPTPQISAWPDRYYHSSEDTPDRLSASTLGRSGAIVGTYLHLLSTAGADEARWLAGLAMQDWKQRICQAVAEALNAPAEDQSRQEAGNALVSLIEHMGLQGHDAIVQARRFAKGDEQLAADLRGLGDEFTQFAGQEAQQAAGLFGLPDLPECEGTLSEEPEAKLIPRCLRCDPLPDTRLSEAARSELEKLAGEGESKRDLQRIWPWINGRRTVADLQRRLRHGGEIPLATMVAYLRLMAREGALSLSGDADGGDETHG